MDEGGRNDDARPKLLQNGEDHIQLAGQGPVKKNWTEDTESACCEDDKEQSDTKRNVVVSTWCFASTLSFAANAMSALH
jgi:hypothetical protein